MPASEKNKSRKFHSLTVILAFSFLALSVLILLIASSFELYFRYKSQEKIVATQQQLIAREAADSVKNYIQKKFEVLETTMRVGDLAIANHKEQRLILEKLQDLEPAFRQLSLLNGQGQELQRLSRVPKLAINQSIMQFKTKFFPLVSQGKTYVSSVYIDKTTSEPLMIMALPVTDVFDDFKGILIAEVNLKFMWDLVDRIKIGKTGVAYVVDKQGRLIAFGDISRVLSGEKVTHLPEVAEFIEGNINTHKIDTEIVMGINNNRVVANHEHLDIPDWAVIVELPAKEAYQPVITTLQRSVIFIIACIVLATMICIYLSRK